MDLEDSEHADQSQDDSEHYFADATETIRALTADIDRLNTVVSALQQIDERFREIDCDFGCATVSISQESDHIQVTGEAWIPLDDVGKFNLLRTDVWDDQQLDWDEDRSLAVVTIEKAFSLKGDHDAE